MEKNEAKKKPDIKELLIDSGCLVLSYVMLFLLPEKTGILFYLLIGVSASLFCVGFFRLGFLVDIPKSRKSEILAAAGFLVYGAAANGLGLFRLTAEQGSGRSIAVATVLIIQAVMLYAMAGSKAEAPRTVWVMSLLFRAAAVLCAVTGVVYIICKDFSEGAIAVCGMLLIEGVVLWAMGKGNNPFNTFSSGIQTIPGMKKKAAELQKDFAGTETQLGCPWTGRIRTIREECIIYGPSEEDGYFIYGFYNFGRFYVAGGSSDIFLDTAEADTHRIAEIPDKSGRLLDHEMLPEVYAEMFRRYLRDGKTIWSTKLPKKKN